MATRELKMLRVDFKKNPWQEPEEDVYDQEDLLFFRTLLLKKREEILKDIQSILGSEKMKWDVNEMKDEVDLATTSMAHDITIRLLDRSRKLLNEISFALQKFAIGDYGYCEGTGELIPRKRLELAPWVRYSVEHKGQLEQIKKKTKHIKMTGGIHSALVPDDYLLHEIEPIIPGV
ncbi:MAG: TraR/DksA C4-type zinc finger protein [Oligoflexales bacterium]|nr:TraR/DksA C4-type zinc finger protein [Oligoflexales bacterium]